MKKVAGFYALTLSVMLNGARKRQSSLPPRHLYQNMQSMQALTGMFAWIFGSLFF